MAIKKSELYSSIWKSCDELRGGMDASQYKDYVLTMLFVKYVSDKYAGKRGAIITVPEGGGFADMVALKGKKDIGEKIRIIISKLAEANELVGVIDNTDFSDEEKLGKGQAMVDRLSNLIAIFESPSLNFSRNRADGDDLLGDAYEYLMRHFATESGKSKGQFYTPSEVSRIMAKVVGISQSSSQEQTIYDPTCGSGSLLLKAADEAPSGITIYGQEMDISNSALAKMNMILHNNPAAVHDIHGGNSTLSHPEHLDKNGHLKTFDFVVANPPFSTKSWRTGFNPEQDEFTRFEYGIPPAKNGDYAFLLHIIKSLKSTGRGAVILPHGVLFRGNAESTIRRELVRRGYIKGIIGLPANLFYGTGIPACIVVIDKENAASRTGIFMIDASKGFIKDGNKNRLRAQDIHKIVDVFNKQIEITGYSRMVPVAEIASPANECNLNIPRYIDNSEAEDIHDIAAHLKGGIPARDVDALSNYWGVFPSLRATLFAENGRAGYLTPKVEAAEVKHTIFHHPEFTAYADKVRTVFAAWKTAQTKPLKALALGSNPKATIHAISEDLLTRFGSVPLLDKYDVYQQLMNYWADVMQDDLFAIASEGWVANSDLIPANLVVARYFAQAQKTIDAHQAEAEEFARQIEEIEEEHSGEDGLLEDAKNDKGKLTKASIKARLKAIKTDADAGEERALLSKLETLMDKESAASKQAKGAAKALEKEVTTKYATLTEAEIKALVVDDKWMATLECHVMSEMERVTQALASRIKQLEERYTAPLPKLEKSAEEYRSKVETHLKKMGFAW
jgi:type I restriction enzyme M protein